MKIKRIKDKISRPGYIRERIISLGEQYGAWYAECELAERIGDYGRLILAEKFSKRLQKKIHWYVDIEARRDYIKNGWKYIEYES